MSAYSHAVETYCKGLDSVAPGCLGVKCEHANGDEGHQCEASFSPAQCDSCGSTYAGDRSPGFGMWHEGNEVIFIDMVLCVDCVLYHANADEPEAPWYQSPQDYRDAGNLAWY